MSDTVQSQGQKMAEISGLLSGSRSMPAEVNGDSFGLEQVSSKAPTVREERSVRKVPQPDRRDLEEEISPMVLALNDMKVPTLTPQFFQRGEALDIEITKFHNAAQELMQAADLAESRGDHGIAANFKVEAGSLWASTAEMRAAWMQMRDQFQQVENLKQLIQFQKFLLGKHGWLSSAREWKRCLSWAMKEYNAIDENQILWAQPQEIVAGLEAYEAVCRKSGYQLGKRTAVERSNASTVSAKAKSLKRAGKLSPERQASLVSELLRGAIG